MTMAARIAVHGRHIKVFERRIRLVFVAVVLISYTMHDLFLTGYDSMLAVTLITIVGAMMVHVFCPDMTAVSGPTP